MLNCIKLSKITLSYSKISSSHGGEYDVQSCGGGFFEGF
jgi:hypothetical protein